MNCHLQYRVNHGLKIKYFTSKIIKLRTELHLIYDFLDLRIRKTGWPQSILIDEHQRIIQLELSYNGAAVIGTSMREINYPDGVSSIESLCVRRRSALLAVSGKAGGLHDHDLANSNVKQLLRNSSYSGSEIKRLCHYGDVIVFTDIIDRKVKTITVETLMGTGKEGSNDGTGETCTFAQVHGICCLQNTLCRTQLPEWLK